MDTFFVCRALAYGVGGISSASKWPGGVTASIDHTELPAKDVRVTNLSIACPDKAALVAVVGALENIVRELRLELEVKKP